MVFSPGRPDFVEAASHHRSTTVIFNVDDPWRRAPKPFCANWAAFLPEKCTRPRVAQLTR